MKKQLIMATPQVISPILRVAVQNHYDTKRLQQREEFEVRLAEKRRQTLQSAKGEQPAGPDPFAADLDPTDDEPDLSGRAGPHGTIQEAVELANDLDSALDHAIEREECEFCADVLRNLQDQPPDVQRQGLEELHTLKGVIYAEEKPTREEIDATMDRLEVVPEMVV